MKQVVTHSFDAYFNSDSEILILGSMPSVKSRELGFYYMHSRNRFWTVLSKIYEEEIPENISLKKEFLKKHRIALWDVLQSCEIENSSDSSISNVITNDIKGLLEKTNIQKMKKNVPFRYGPTITNYHWKCLSSPMLQFFAYSNLSLLLYFY